MTDATSPSPAFAADVMTARVKAYADERPGIACKGVLPSFQGRFADLGAAGLALGDEALPMPIALLRESAMRANSAWMSHFLHLSGLSIAPHGKTVMSPEIFRLQMEDGAWGMTAGTAQQAALCVDLGVRRLLLANQLVEAGNVRLVQDLIERHPDLVFYCLADSTANADELAAAVKARGLPEEYRVVRLNDQHAHLRIPVRSPLQVGDLVGFGISHACTTFDKWRCLLVVDDSYRVTGAVRTFF